MKVPNSIWRTFSAVAFLPALALGVRGRAAEPPADDDQWVRTPKSGDWDFSILPKAFQRHPTLDMTFNTELTPFGRLLRPASAEHPVYYVEQDAGFKPLGWSTAGEHPPPSTDMDRVLTRALATNGFLLASPEHPAALALIYFWGSHNKPDQDLARKFPELARKYVLERAILVGGRKFADGMGFAMEWGESPADRETKREFLRDQAAEELYYVVASAYDYPALARGERKLAWRTTMTVTSAGLAMRETLPPLVASAAPFFGRDMTEPEIGARRISRAGRVEVGTPTVVEDKAPAAETAKKKNGQ